MTSIPRNKFNNGDTVRIKSNKSIWKIDQIFYARRINTYYYTLINEKGKSHSMFWYEYQLELVEHEFYDLAKLPTGLYNIIKEDK